MLFSLLIASALCTGDYAKIRSSFSDAASTYAGSNLVRSVSNESVRSVSSAWSRISDAEARSDREIAESANQKLEKFLKELDAVIEAAEKEEQRWNDLTPEEKEAELYDNSTKAIDIELANLAAQDQFQLSEEVQNYLHDRKQFLVELKACEDYPSRQEYYQKRAEEEAERIFAELMEAQKKWEEEHPEEVAALEEFKKQIEEEVERWNNLTQKEQEQELYDDSTKAIEFELDNLTKAYNELEMTKEDRKFLGKYMDDLVSFRNCEDYASRQEFAEQKVEEAFKQLNAEFEKLLAEEAQQ